MASSAAPNDHPQHLANWPRVTLGFNRDGDASKQKGFYVTNHNSTLEARAVQLRVTRSPHYLLTSHVIPFLAGGATMIPFEFHAELAEISDTEERVQHADGPEALQVFATDVWLQRIPTPESDTAAAMFEVISEAMANDWNSHTALVLPLAISYTDLSGVPYTSHSEVLWHVIGGVLEIRPGLVQQEPIPAIEPPSKSKTFGLATFWHWVGGKWQWPSLFGAGCTTIKFGEYGIGWLLLVLSALAAMSKIAHWTTPDASGDRRVRTLGYFVVSMAFILSTIITFNLKGNEPWSHLFAAPAVLARPFPWLEFNEVRIDDHLAFVRLTLAVEDRPNTPFQDTFASLSSLENLHVEVVARVQVSQQPDGTSQGMNCTIADFQVPEWNNDDAARKPIGNLKLRPHVTVLGIMASASTGRWNGTSVIFNRGTHIDTDEYMAGAFTVDSGRTPLSTRRIMTGPISSADVKYTSEPLAPSAELVNQGAEAPPYTPAQAKAACADFIYH